MWFDIHKQGCLKFIILNILCILIGVILLYQLFFSVFFNYVFTGFSPVFSIFWKIIFVGRKSNLSSLYEYKIRIASSYVSICHFQLVWMSDQHRSYRKSMKRYTNSINYLREQQCIWASIFRKKFLARNLYKRLLLRISIFKFLSVIIPKNSNK